MTSSTDDNFPAAQVEVREMLKRYSLENLECPVATSGNENGGTRKEGRGGKQSRVVDKSDSGGERYEKGVAKHGDAAFMKFQKELRKCSSQLLRFVVCIFSCNNTQKTFFFWLFFFACK